MSNDTDNIVTRLRAWASHPPSLRGTPLALAAMDAANEIERLQGREMLLRGVINDQLAEIAELQVAGDALAQSYERALAALGFCREEREKSLRAWQEARRG